VARESASQHGDYYTNFNPDDTDSDLSDASEDTKVVSPEQTEADKLKALIYSYGQSSTVNTTPSQKAERSTGFPSKSPAHLISYGKDNTFGDIAYRDIAGRDINNTTVNNYTANTKKSTPFTPRDMSYAAATLGIIAFLVLSLAYFIQNAAIGLLGCGIFLVAVIPVMGIIAHKRKHKRR